MRTDPVLGGPQLSDLLSSIAASIGLSEFDHRLELPAGERWVVVLVDGLGWNALLSKGDDPLGPPRGVEGGVLSKELGFLPSAATAQPIQAAVPTTTVTSLTSFGTGATTGQHGMVGHSFRLPRAKGAILDPLHWALPHSPRHVQPVPTVFEQISDQVQCTTVSLDGFADSGLTEAALRGPQFQPVDARLDLSERAPVIRAAAVAAPKTLVYTYIRDLDAAGHQFGCQSDRWREQLRIIDEGVARLREVLPDDVRLVLTADHGMVDVPQAKRWMVQEHPELIAGVDALAGEARFRHLYVDTDDPRAVASRWSDQLGSQAWVRCRDDAIDEGWFGPVADSMLERLGAVIVAMRDDSAILTRHVVKEHRLVGMHGSLTPAELEIPLLVW